MGRNAGIRWFDQSRAEKQAGRGKGAFFADQVKVKSWLSSDNFNRSMWEDRVADTSRAIVWTAWHIKPATSDSCLHFCYHKKIFAKIYHIEKGESRERLSWEDIIEQLQYTAQHPLTYHSPQLELA